MISCGVGQGGPQGTVHKFALILIVIIKLFLLVHGTTNMTGMQDAHPFCDLDTR